MKAYQAYLYKEWLCLMQRPQQFFALLLFSCAILVLFHFSLPTDLKPQVSSGVYWTQFLLTSILAYQKTFLHDEHSGMVVHLQLSLAGPLVYYFGRLTSHGLFLGFIQSFNLVLVGLMYDQRIFSHFFVLLLVIGLATWGICALGLLFTARLMALPLVEFLLAILFIPLSLPLLLSASELFLFYTDAPFYNTARAWWKLLLLYDLIVFMLGLIFVSFLD